MQNRGVLNRAENQKLVRKRGFEPPRGCPRQPLKLVRLPFRHFREREGFSEFTIWNSKFKIEEIQKSKSQEFFLDEFPIRNCKLSITSPVASREPALTQPAA